MKKVFLFLCIFLLFTYLFYNVFRPVTAINEDLGEHLLLGKIITQSHAIPKSNLLSFTYPDYPFINSGWLSEVIFFTVYTNFGFNGLITLATILFLLSFFIIFQFIFKKYPPFISLASGLLYANILVTRTDIRPELFSLFFLSLFITVLYANYNRYTKWLIILVPLEIIWANTHIYFFTGIIVLLFFFIDRMINEKFHPSRPTKILGTTSLLAMLGTFINPNGIQGALFPITVQQHYRLDILENQNIFSLNGLTFDINTSYFICIVSLLFILLVLYTYYNKRKTRLVDWLLVISFSFAGIFIIRSMPLFAYTTLIPFTAALTFVLTAIATYFTRHNGKKHLALLKISSISLFILVVIAKLLQLSYDQPPGFGISERGKKSADFFLQKNVEGPIFNNYDIGSYLAYRLYPQKVFIDNRPEAYPENFQQAYSSLYVDEKQFEDEDKNYNFNAIFITHWNRAPWSDTLFASILTNPDYTLIYLDDYAVILAKKNEKNKKLIERYALTERTFSLPMSIKDRELIRYIYFFEKAGWQTQAKRAYQMLLQLDPHNCTMERELSSIKTYYQFKTIENLSTHSNACQH